MDKVSGSYELSFGQSEHIHHIVRRQEKRVFKRSAERIVKRQEAAKVVSWWEDKHNPYTILPTWDELRTQVEPLLKTRLSLADMMDGAKDTLARFFDWAGETAEWVGETWEDISKLVGGYISDGNGDRTRGFEIGLTNLVPAETIEIVKDPLKYVSLPARRSFPVSIR